MRNGKRSQFTASNQPSSKAKSEGWDRRRERLKLLDSIVLYLDMNLLEFERISDKINDNDPEYTVRDMITIEYIRRMKKSDRLLLDWIERHLSKVKRTETKEDEQQFTKIEVEFLPPPTETMEESAAKRVKN